LVTALQLFRIFCYNFGSNGRQMTYFEGKTPALDFSYLHQ